VLRSDDRGRTFRSISGDLPARHPVWSVIQDHVNGDLIFAGTEFGLFVTVDGGRHWAQLKGGLPVAQIRDMTVQRRETDLVLGTFGRGFYVLDDYSALREINAQALASQAELFPLRHAYQFATLSHERAAYGNWRTPNPPYGAQFTYHVGSGMSGQLALRIANSAGQQVRRLAVSSTPGIHRVTWDLTGTPEAPAAAPGGRGGGGGANVAADAAAGRTGGAATQVAVQVDPPGRAAGAGAAGAAAQGGAQGGGAGRAGAGGGQGRGGGGGGGRGGGGRGGGGGDPVDAGRYTATLVLVNGDQTTPVGKTQSFQVVPLPSRNY
jgi:hypothetical protein